MNKDNDIYRKTVLAAQNHITRAQEGIKLLSLGKSLKEMKTPIIGLETDDLIINRNKKIQTFEHLTVDNLKARLQQIEERIEKANNRDEKGTSELYWERLIILSMLEK